MNFFLQIRDFGTLDKIGEKEFFKELNKLFIKYNLTGRYD